MQSHITNVQYRFQVTYNHQLDLRLNFLFAPQLEPAAAEALVGGSEAGPPLFPPYASTPSHSADRVLT